MLATKVISKFRRTYYALINRLALYKYMRWTFTFVLVLLYIETVQSSSYDIATYLIGFYLLQLLIGYFTPKGVIDDDVDAQEAESLYHFEDELCG
jgi:Rer1 family